MKLITFYTPSHEPLAKKLLASRIEEYRLCVITAKQRGVGLYHAPGFVHAMLDKMQAIRQEATEDFVFSEADVVFLRPSLALIEKEMQGFDVLFQDIKRHWYCTGLFAMRVNARTLGLINDCIRILESRLRYDQEEERIINELLPQSDVRYGFLSARWSNPFLLLDGKGYDGERLTLPDDAVAFHANGLKRNSIENKVKLIDTVWAGLMKI